MFKNISPDTNMDHNDPMEGEMQNVNKNKFLDIGTTQIYRNPYLINLDKYTDNENLFNDFKTWWTQRHRKNPKTAKKYIKNLENMVNDKYIPCDFTEINPAQIITHLDYYEKINKEHPWSIINKWKAVTALYKSCGHNTEVWGYTPPNPPPPKVKIIPLPQTVYNLITNKYTKNVWMNHFIQYILYQGFLLGLRPEEFPIWQIDNCFLEDGYIIIQEPKKNGQKRQVFPEPELLSHPYRKSIYNWIKWRKKIPSENNLLWIQKNGKPYTVDYLRNKLNEYVKPIWPQYHPYIMRHWCAIARLIHSKCETGKWDTWEVKEWLGHDDEKTTQNYIRYADKYYRIAHFDWIKAMLKFHRKKYGEQQNGLLLENSDTAILRGLPKIPTGENRCGPEDAHINFLLTKFLESTIIKGLSKIQYLFSKPSLFFFYKYLDFFNKLLGKWPTGEVQVIAQPKNRVDRVKEHVHISSVHLRCLYSVYSKFFDEFIMGTTRGLKKYISPYNLHHLNLWFKGEPLGSLLLKNIKKIMLNIVVLQNCDSNTKKGCNLLLHFFHNLYLKFTIS